jgi:hypothetical protein
VWSSQEEGHGAEELVLLGGRVIVEEKEVISLPLHTTLDEAFLPLIQGEHEILCDGREPNKFIDSHLQLDNLAIKVVDSENGFLYVGVLGSSGFHDFGPGFGEVLLFQSAVVDQSPIGYFGVAGEERRFLFHQGPKT